MATIDVRPMLAAGHEPFPAVMAAAERLRANEPLIVVAPFEPKPLYGALASRGFSHSSKQQPDGSWAVTFTPQSAASTRGAWAEQRLYQPFVIGALIVALTLGFTTGATMLLLPVLGLALGSSLSAVIQAHGMAQVFGWGGLFVMGFAFHVVPRFTRTSIPFPVPQRVTLGLALGAIGLRFAGQFFYAHWTSPVFLVLSGILLLAAVLLFIAVIAPPLVRASAPGLTEAWLGMGLLWATVAAALHMAMVVAMAAQDAVRSAPGALDAAFIHAGLMGFLGSCILGVGVHALPGFMSLQAPRRGLGRASIVAMNLGILSYVSAALLDLPAAWRAGAWMLELLAAAVFILSIRVFEATPRKRPYISGTYARYEWYVRAAYLWLLVGAGLGAIDAWDSAIGANLIPAGRALPSLHVLALGFVSMVIFGMAARMLPIFEGGELPHHRFMDAAFWLLNASVLSRLVFGLASIGAEIGLAVSGLSGLAALVLFAVVAVRGMSPAAREAYRQRIARLTSQRVGQPGRKEIPLRQE